MAGRPHSNFVNFRVDNTLTSDRANFIDYIHYRSIIANKLSDAIIDTFRLAAATKIDF